MIVGFSRTGHQYKKTVWVVNMRVARKPYSSAIHTSKGDKNT
jgi:hypothetical protein